jgi:hypothetical protein
LSFFLWNFAAVAPGPVWTPLIPASFKPEQTTSFGEETTINRAGETDEIAPSYVFLASKESALYTGQCHHPNGKRSKICAHISPCSDTSSFFVARKFWCFFFLSQHIF